MNGVEKIVSNNQLTVYDAIGSNSKWGRVDCQWVETKTDGNEKKNLHIISMH